MNVGELLNIIEDKSFIPNVNWYFHATSADINVIKEILQDGIKSAYLRNERGNHFNGKYYISLYKNTKDAERLKFWLYEYPKFILEDVFPFYADRNKFKLRKMFINTRIPLRTSEWDGEYHQYLQIKSDKIVALEYNLSKILSEKDEFVMKDKLQFLQDIILCLQQINKNLPIYDIYSTREINKEKVLSLNL